MMTSTTGDDRSGAIWQSPWLRPFNDVAALDDLLAQIHPTWSLARIKARVLAVIDETADTKTFVLHPNRRWPGFRAGQHIGVEVEIGGVRHQRRYSLSSLPGRGHVAFTVKRQSAGKVSSWLHAQIHPGDVLTLDAPAGDFVLPERLPPRLLMLSAGSGVTPLMAMVRTLAAARARVDVAFVHVARRPADAIFAAELRALTTAWSGLRVQHHHSETSGRFDVAALERAVPDYGDRLSFLCGPAGFMTTMREHWEARGLDSRLRLESFGAPCATAPRGATTALEVRCTRSERLFTAPGIDPLLAEAERAGLRPRYGCRMGICHTCSCVKRSGIVENLLTGELSTEPDERIQLCISRARTDLTLDL
jgi:stearoyl-CoA 9-desaturase NADPH oxidoreductase